METPECWGNGQDPPRATDSAPGPLSPVWEWSWAGLGLLLAGAAHQAACVPPRHHRWRFLGMPPLPPWAPSPPPPPTWSVCHLSLPWGSSSTPDWPPDHTWEWLSVGSPGHLPCSPWVIQTNTSQVRAGTWTGVAVGPRTSAWPTAPLGKGTAGTVSGDWGPLPPPASVSLFQGKSFPARASCR